MKPDGYRRLLLRDLHGFGAQIEAYPDDAGLWARPDGFVNAPGNLALHVAGNLRHFVGHVLGGLDYERDREAEFGTRDLPRARLVARLREAASAVDATLRDFDERRLADDYPVALAGRTLPTGVFLAHLCTHLAYHLGQVDAHRRITTGQGALPGVQGFAPLVD